jgi:hypothetical protein
LLVGTRGGHVLALSVSVDGPVHRHIVDADQIADVNALASDEVLCVDLGVANAAAAAFPVECRAPGDA